MNYVIAQGDCLGVMRGMADSSVDAVVTDPPYGLSFMGKKWDYDVPSTETWAECLRVLKPGGHLLAFAGTRTQHRMAVRVEDAGFEIRDMLAWVYATGFPKSHDVAKAIHGQLELGGSSPRKRRQAFMGENYTEGDTVGSSGTERAQERRSAAPPPGSGDNLRDEANRWQGWGTALKPALEPITMARKPLAGNVAKNVLAHGTGGLNIDGCRVGQEVTRTIGSAKISTSAYGDYEGMIPRDNPPGRWPANFIHDGGDEATGFLGESARFFYCAKASKSERGPGCNHPTVKPVALMRYLVRLVTPPGGLVLDPFAGSGTTGAACMMEGFRFVGIELNPEYCEIARKRIETAKGPR